MVELWLILDSAVDCRAAVVAIKLSRKLFCITVLAIILIYLSLSPAVTMSNPDTNPIAQWLTVVQCSMV